MKKMS